jgi:N-acyl-D-aspartate/D-glutamate deacylase
VRSVTRNGNQTSSGKIDLVVRGGTLVDGTGASPVAGDLAISDSEIVEVGGRIDAPGAEVIDASGAIVAPGNVIDLDSLSVAMPQSHQDLPAGGSRLLQAITGYEATILNGAVTRRGR